LYGARQLSDVAMGWYKAQQPVTEDTEHYNGIEISLEKEDDEIMVKAMMANGRELGHVLFVDEGDYLMPQDLEVDERYQGQGIAATMYDYVKSKGYKIRRSGQQTDAGAGFWNKHRSEQNVWEASGYIPSEKEKNDPRFKTALTVDVKPDSIKKNAKAFAWLTDRAGVPPTAKANGKI
jgi:GNAT superfamily N-acetyltransferase